MFRTVWSRFDRFAEVVSAMLARRMCVARWVAVRAQVNSSKFV